MLREMRKRVEEALGLPSIEAIAGLKNLDVEKLYGVLEKLPDKGTLRELNKTLEACERLSKSMPDLEKLIRLLSIVKDLDVQGINKVLTKLESLIKRMPKEGMDVLIKLAGELKK